MNYFSWYREPHKSKEVWWKTYHIQTDAKLLANSEMVQGLQSV